MSNYYGVNSSSELYHYRTKGSKNGERRYQYEDGSYTPEGYIHYGHKPRGEKKAEVKTSNKKKPNNSIANQIAKNTWRAIKGTPKATVHAIGEAKEKHRINVAAKEKYDKVDRKTGKNMLTEQQKIRQMSSEDLKKAIDHIDLENKYHKKVEEYNAVHKSTKEKAKELRKAVILDFIDKAVIPAAKDTIKDVGKSYLERKLGLDIKLPNYKEQAEIAKLWADVEEIQAKARNQDAQAAETWSKADKNSSDRFINMTNMQRKWDNEDSEKKKNKHTKELEKNYANVKLDRYKENEKRKQDLKDFKKNTLYNTEKNTTDKADKQKKETAARTMRSVIEMYKRSGDYRENGDALTSKLRSIASAAGYDASDMSLNQLTRIMYDNLNHSYLYGTNFSVNSSELYHYGVKGQKKGERQYQYPDGSYTPLGYEHYGHKPRESNYFGPNNSSMTGKAKAYSTAYDLEEMMRRLYKQAYHSAIDGQYYSVNSRNS